MSSLLRLYPPAWRSRYGTEVVDLLESSPPDARARLDLARGALDAWLHPIRPSPVPGVAALTGGALWTLIALEVVRQPAPPDWPGYVVEVLLPAMVVAGLLLVAVVGAWLRTADEGGRLGVAAVGVAVLGYVLWMLALLVAATGLAYGPATAIAQTAAATGTVAVALVGLRRGDTSAGLPLLLAGCGLVAPSTWAWLVTGIAWQAVGVVMLWSWVSRGGAAGRRPRSG